MSLEDASPKKKKKIDLKDDLFGTAWRLVGRRAPYSSVDPLQFLRSDEEILSLILIDLFLLALKSWLKNSRASFLSEET